MTVWKNYPLNNNTLVASSASFEPRPVIHDCHLGTPSPNYSKYLQHYNSRAVDYVTTQLLHMGGRDPNNHSRSLARLYSAKENTHQIAMNGTSKLNKGNYKVQDKR